MLVYESAYVPPSSDEKPSRTCGLLLICLRGKMVRFGAAEFDACSSYYPLSRADGCLGRLSRTNRASIGRVEAARRHDY